MASGKRFKDDVVSRNHLCSPVSFTTEKGELQIGALVLSSDHYGIEWKARLKRPSIFQVAVDSLMHQLRVTLCTVKSQISSASILVDLLTGGATSGVCFAHDVTRLGSSLSVICFLYLGGQLSASATVIIFCYVGRMFFSTG
jgi:hypothetical protein